MKQLDDLRKEIDRIDKEIMNLLNKRFDITNKIGTIKRAKSEQTLNKDRENDILIKALEQKNSTQTKKVYESILDISKESQKYNSYLLIKDASYTYSTLIHNLFNNPYYKALENTSLEELLESDNYHFKGLNITNPYKSEAYEYCLKNDIELDSYAKRTKVINLIISGEKKKAYNTDYIGFKSLLDYHNISLDNLDVLILGNGSTSKTIEEVLKEYSCKSVHIAVRTKRNDDEIYLNEITSLSNIDVVINATSYGVYPNIELDPLVDLSNTNTSLIIDVNYNPNRPSLALKHPNIKYINGLFMLVEQARISEELIMDKTISIDESINVYKNVLKQTLNFCLIGMPFSGKTTLGEILSQKYGKIFFDSDIILKEESLSLAKLLSLGLTLEDYREYESRVIETLAFVDNAIISTGGGVIENPSNIFFLKQKGLIIFIDTPLDILKSRIKSDRPLVKNESDLEKLFEKRYNIYKENADIIFKCSGNLDQDAKNLEALINEYFNN